MTGKLLLAAAFLALTPVAASSAGDCILDNCADQKPLPSPNPSAPSPASTPDRPTGFGRSGPGPRGASVPGQFDFYVLSLSWSPGFCQTGGAKKGRDQCDSGANLGFVVHGLWPQYDHGFPSDCRGQSAPSRIALSATDGVYPDEGLARYEWRKHGTCSGLSPTDYFANAKAARDAVVIPQPFKDAHQDQRWAPVDVERAFIAANPRLRPGMLAAVCQHGVMEEVRICFTKDLKSFQACPEVVRDRCRAPAMSVPPVR
ncbi:ribonuclease T2 [Beijerinckia sp. L45]|uniref:ribonuclease T2 family protein n=1 Tax=Beijerinckia sp. L45 TaxID=1641855 RepID=UPI00131A956E|nr:ribonuclease T2 [Beijerinckia sp. L45]